MSVQIVQRVMRSLRWNCALVLLLSSGCTTGDQKIAATTPAPLTTIPQGPPPTVDQPVTFPGIHFVVPAVLNYHATGIPPSTMGEVLGYYATAPLTNPCQITEASISCSVPLTTLPRGAMLISWANVAFPKPPDQPDVADVNTTIGGQAAKLTTEHPGSCGDIGADETITAEITRPAAPGNHYEMRACIREPNATANERLVSTMLASVGVDN